MTLTLLQISFIAIIVIWFILKIKDHVNKINKR